MQIISGPFIIGAKPISVWDKDQVTQITAQIDPFLIFEK